MSLIKVKTPMTNSLNRGDYGSMEDRWKDMRIEKIVPLNRLLWDFPSCEVDFIWNLWWFYTPKDAMTGSVFVAYTVIVCKNGI